MKTICISAKDDGSFSVYEEKPEAMEPMGGEEGMPQAPEAAAGALPGQPMEEAEPEGTPVASIDEALEMARQMLQDDGRSPEEQMMAGYAKGKPAMAKPSPAQVFGE